MADQYVGHISVCGCCMLMHANGECCDQPHGTDDYPEPLSDLTADQHITVTLADGDEGYFSWGRCGSCGSRLGGTRFDACLWESVATPV